MRRLSLLLAGIFACSSIPIAYAATTASERNVKIGVIADLTGSAGAYGTAQRQAYDLAADDLRSGRLHAGNATIAFDVEDAASDPAQVINLTQKFAGDGTALLIGPTLSAEAKKADPVAVQAGLTVLATSNTAQGITSMGPCVFRDSLAEEQVVPETISRSAARWKPKTAAIIYGDDNQFTKTDFEIFRAALEKHRITITDVQTYHTGDVDFKAQLTKIAAGKPDVLVVGSLLDEAVKIVAQAHQVGLQAHVIGGNGLNSPKFISLAGKDADGVVVGAAYDRNNQYTGNREFVARYTKKFGTGPDQFAAQAYAAAQIAVQAVRGGASTPAQFCTALKSAKVFTTVLGPLAFSSTRDARAASAILTISHGQFIAFK